jgi:hypothetical protein
MKLTMHTMDSWTLAQNFRVSGCAVNEMSVNYTATQLWVKEQQEMRQ